MGTDPVARYRHDGELLAGRYRLERPLGAGGFGVVYLGTQLPLGRAVAIKLLSPTGGASTARFEQEAALAQRLDHPNTVRIVDFGLGPDGLPFIVWEYLRGETLEQMLAARGALAPSTARRIAVQVLKSLMEAHALGIVHRDIKPANVFITSHPGEPFFVKVLDFGIAKDTFAPPLAQASEDATSPSNPFTPVDHTTGGGHTRASQIVGTPRYMAPEQARGQRVGPETDLFAVGLVLSEMLSGRKVFDQASSLELLVAQGSEDPTPIPPDVAHGPLGPIVLRATEKRRHVRYRDAAEMLAALESIPLQEVAAATSFAPSAPPATGFAPTLSGPLPTFAATRADARAIVAPARAKRRGALTLALAGAALLGLAGLGTIGYLALAAKPTRPRAKTSTETSRSSDEAAAPPAHTGAALLPLPDVDWARRAVPKYDEARLRSRVEKAGYSIKETRPISNPGFDSTVMLTVSRPPCSGVVFYYDFAKQSDADMVFDAQVKNGHGRFVHTGPRAILVAVVRAEHPEGDPTCADPLAAAITE